MAKKKPIAKKPGPPTKEFSDDERVEFLTLRRTGLGVRTVLQKMGVGYGRYRRELQENKEFRDEAKGIDDELIEGLVSLRYQAAVNGDDSAQEYLISRYDKGKQFAANMRLKRDELAKNDATNAAAQENIATLREFLGGLRDARDEKAR